MRRSISASFSPTSMYGKVCEIEFSSRINASPDGVNINDGCGSTHPARLAAAGFGEITTEIAPAGEFYYAEDYQIGRAHV